MQIALSVGQNTDGDPWIIVDIHAAGLSSRFGMPAKQAGEWVDQFHANVHNLLTELANQTTPGLITPNDHTPSGLVLPNGHNRPNRQQRRHPHR